MKKNEITNLVLETFKITNVEKISSDEIVSIIEDFYFFEFDDLINFIGCVFSFLLENGVQGIFNIDEMILFFDFSKDDGDDEYFQRCQLDLFNKFDKNQSLVICYFFNWLKSLPSMKASDHIVKPVLEVWRKKCLDEKCVEELNQNFEF